MTKSSTGIAESAEAGWLPLVRMAEDHGLALRSRWAVLEVDFPAAFDLAELEALCETSAYDASVEFGDDRIELDVTAEPLSEPQVTEVSPLAATEAEARNVRGTSSGWQVAAQLSHLIERTKVSYRRTNWCISVDRLAELVTDDWLSVADRLVEGPVVVGDTEMNLLAATEWASQVLVPQLDVSTDSADAAEAAKHFALLADAAAWREIAISEDRRDDGLWLALCQDQPEDIQVCLQDAAGGVDLLRWLGDGSDPNRNEALRHVLRSQTAVARRLPRASDVKTLAERHRFALARDNAAEVYRAVGEGQRRTADTIDEAKQRLSQHVEDTTRVLQGTLVAATGLAALIIRAGSTLPIWLLAVITFAAVSGLWVLGRSRCRSARELEESVSSFGAELKQELLLPEDERHKLAETLARFDAAAHRKRVRNTVMYLGSLAAGVIVATVVWLATVDESSQRQQSPETKEPAAAS